MTMYLWYLAIGTYTTCEENLEFLPSKFFFGDRYKKTKKVENIECL